MRVLIDPRICDFFDVVWMVVLHPMVSNGVAAYSNGPLKYTNAEMCGLSVAWHRRISVRSIWPNKLSHINLVKSGSTPARTDKNVP